MTNQASKMADTRKAVDVFDRGLLRKKRNRYISDAENSFFLVNWTARNIAERLQDIKKTFPHTFITGLRTKPEILNNIAAQKSVEFLTLSDLAENALNNHNGIRIQSDAEYLPFADQSLDLIINILDLHNINDLPGALIQARRALRPDGLFLAAMFGGETLHELRSALTQAELEIKDGASPRIFPFADKQQMGALMQRAGFALPVVDSEIITVTYKSFTKLLHDLRSMGEGNIILNRSKNFAGKNYFESAERNYRENFSDRSGKMVATFEIIFLIGWAPHESQQKPLKPGSAKNRLADALQTQEYKGD